MWGILLKPFLVVGSAFNTAANLYLAGQLSWWAFKEVRKMQKEKLKADELRTRFVSEYVAEFDKEPSEQEISAALRAYNAVEHPVQERVKQVFGQGAKGKKDAVRK
tara:strand:+ start:216 stop:533 length:318 start_codon:yes stop_codon:yes gene_type:complete